LGYIILKVKLKKLVWKLTVEKIEVNTDTAPVVGKEIPRWQGGNQDKGSRWARNEELRKQIVSLLNELRKPMCVEEIAEAVECAWVTARQILSDLALEGKVKFSRDKTRIWASISNQ